MEEEKKRKITIPMICSVLSFLGGCISYFYIENEIPLQWDVHWEVAKTAPKEAVFLMSAVPLLLYLIMSSKAVFHKHERKDKASNITTIAITYLLILLQWISIGVALEVELEVSVILPVITGIVFLIVGNFMPIIQRNYFIGFRTPWTIRNEISWKKTNRYGGYFMSIFGILMIANGIYQNEILIWFTVGFAIVGIVSGCLYSYHLRHAK